MHSHGLREMNISTAGVLLLTVACESKSCIVLMVCVVYFFFLFLFFALLKLFVTNSMNKEMELKTECETKPRYIHKIL